MCALESKLEWLLLGQDQSVKQANRHMMLACSMGAIPSASVEAETAKLIDDNVDVSFDLRLFFESEQLNGPEVDSQDEIWKRVKESIRRETSGHFSVALPWRLPREQLKTNEAAAKSHLSSLYRRLKAKEANLVSYNEEMLMLCDAGFV